MEGKFEIPGILEWEKRGKIREVIFYRLHSEETHTRSYTEEKKELGREKKKL